MKDEIEQLKAEIDMIKAENVQLKLENEDLKARGNTSGSLDVEVSQGSHEVFIYIHYFNHPHINHVMVHLKVDTCEPPE